MTVPRLKAMTNYWKHNPPIHMMIAAYLGINKPQAQQAPDLETFMQESLAAAGQQ